MIFHPHDYQQDIIDRIKSSNVLINALMGAGKSACVLEAIRCAKDQVLIIAPKRVAEHTWPAEIAKWDSFADLDYGVCTGTLPKRQKVLKANHHITIINRENVPWLVQHYGMAWPFRLVVVDESSSFRNPKALRFKALKKVLPRSDKVVLMSGTVTPNSMMDLWAQVYLLDGGQRLGKSFYKFRDKYYESDYMGYKWTPRDGAEEHITRLVADLCIVVESYEGLPDRVDLTEGVTMPGSAMRDYEALERDHYHEIGGRDITAANAAVVSGKLLQAASGAVYDDAGDWHLVHDEKLEALAGLLEQAEGENVLVAYNYRHEYDRIKAAYPDAVSIKDDGAIDAWNRGEVRLMLAAPASAGHGLNLWEGGNRIVWFSPTWSNELKQQFDARLLRQGQDRPVFVHTIIAEGTIDDDVMDVVAGKKSLQDALTDRLSKYNLTT